MEVCITCEGERESWAWPKEVMCTKIGKEEVNGRKGEGCGAGWWEEARRESRRAFI